jgi:hypothetical protein
MAECGANGSDAARGRLIASAISWLAALYLCVQLLVPLIVIVRAGSAARDFSWDMFSSGLTCEKFNAVVKPDGGEWGSVRLDLDFASWAQLRRVLSPARFATYTQRLCQTLREEHGRPVQLYVLSACRADRDQPLFAVVDPKRDFCQPR